MKLSISLPSLFPDDLKVAIENIYATTHGVDYEIVVTSPFEVSGDRIVWVREEEPRGNAFGHHTCFLNSTGDIIVAFTDDAYFVPGWAEIALSRFLEREQANDLFCLGLDMRQRTIGTAFGYYYAFFPMARRQSVERVGVWYDPAFKANLADTDFSMRIWAGGGRCEVSTVGLVDFLEQSGKVEAIHKSKSFDADVATFIQRWSPHFPIDPLTQAPWRCLGFNDFHCHVHFVPRMSLLSDWTVINQGTLPNLLVRNYNTNLPNVDFKVVMQE